MKWSLVPILGVLVAAICTLAALDPVPDDLIRENQELEKRSHALGLRMSRDLPGYAMLLEKFEVKEVTVNSVNRPERVLFVGVLTKQKTGLNAAWWWDPLDGDR